MRVAMFPRQHTLSVVDGGDAVEIVVAPIFKEPTDQHVALQRFGVLGEIGHRVAGARQGLTKLADNRLHRSIEEPLSCRRAIAERAPSAAIRAVLAACSASAAIPATRV